jgi:xylulokinase
MEAVAYRQVDALERIERDNAIHVNRVLAYGGGARETRWNQIKTDIAERPYDGLGNSEVTSLGAALIAGLGVNAIDDPVSVAISARTVQAQFVPNRAASSKYRALRRSLATFAEEVASLGAGRSWVRPASKEQDC